MEKPYEKKITWVIKDFSSLKSIIYSDEFVAGGCKWFLKAYPKGIDADNYFSVFLRVPDSESLPAGWRRHVRYRLTVVNQRSQKLSKSNQIESQHWFEEKHPSWGSCAMLPLDEIHAKDSGFLLNGELMVVADVDVLEVIGKSDVSEKTSTTMETIDLNGFQLSPSQVETARHIFERHPDIVSEFRPKKPNLRTAYMSLLLSLVETMCQLPQELSKDDLSDAYTVLGSMVDAGFKLDWLKKKLDEIREKKEKEEFGETRIQEIEEELKDLKKKCSDLDAQLEKEKAEVLAAKAPFSFDDII